MISLPSFTDFFKALWGVDPFPWQTMLADRVVGGPWPKALDLPTASGKTACMDVAIWALARQAERSVSERTAPRRIWFVVDRRIVVDEAFDRASTIAAKLLKATGGPLKAMGDRLRQVSGTDRPLAVARLRGGILRDDGWARLPSQPAVITSTVDQLGSSLLFRGYGRSHLAAPIFAGLAANDSLVLLDEAHCSVPFLQTLRAVEGFRSPKWAECGIETPFAFTILSATLPPDISQDTVFPSDHERQKALDHPFLHDRMKASKPAELVIVKTEMPSQRDPLVTEASQRARSYVDDMGKERIAVIVNRVRTAKEIASTLQQEAGDSCDVVLLTGQLRPFERDHLVERWKPFLKAREPQSPHKPIILVSTQCIEVGADFSFGALITEAASLDALRQRFGRLNRMGRPGACPAAILIREEDAREDRSDPIYGTAIAKCWRMLDEKAMPGTGNKGPKVVDFGIESLESLLAGMQDPSEFLAPRPDAPILLPAHLDLLCQTAPPPSVEPDIQIFLHGIDRGEPEARVVWRADLDPANVDTWEETIALCPPTSAEALSLSLHRLRRWLTNASTTGDTADVEGVALDEDNGKDGMRPVLLWAGRDRSRPIRRASDIRPNDVVVVPAAYGMEPLSQAAPTQAFGQAQLDLWEATLAAAGKPAALRINRSVLLPWLDCPPVRDLLALAYDPACAREDIQNSIDAVLAYQLTSQDDPASPPPWLYDLLRAAPPSRIERHPGGGIVVFGRLADARLDAEPDLFSDDDDLLSATGQEVSLAVHSESVVQPVKKLANHCLAEDFLAPLRTAACWHDAGKLDERFQVLLRQGDELAAIDGEPLAKSADIPPSPAQRRAIRAASGLPLDFRHEMLSLQLAERYAPLPASKAISDLVLHLIASHHGHARPFAPASPDLVLPAVYGSLDGVHIDLSSQERGSLLRPHTIGAGIPERFWRLTRRYGWWGLAYLEAMLRLGDWYGSRSVLSAASNESPVQVAATYVQTTKTEEEPLILSGIDGSNPLGFLAAVGTLVVLHAAGHRSARLSWRQTATWQPIITGLSATARNTLAELVAGALRGASVAEDAEQRRTEAQRTYDKAKKAVKDKQDEIKNLRLRGKERLDTIQDEVAPLGKDMLDRRQDWLNALRHAIPRPELALGKHIDCTAAEYREQVEGLLIGTGIVNREPLDLLAAFASDACLTKAGRVVATPFCFITGSGHQYFLDTVRQLIDVVDAGRVRNTLFKPWAYTDKRLSMRWDPMEDRRYALMDRDPTASDNETRTMWMANLLAYRALAIFPSAPQRGHLATTGWNHDQNEPAFTWALWDNPVDPDTIRSTVLLPDLAESKGNRSTLRQRGCVAVFRAQRIKVGAGANFKLNFSQARSI